MAKFKVGDVCVIIKAKNFQALVGMEVTIMGGPIDYKDAFSGESFSGYLTDLEWKGISISPPEEYLRLKKFPGEDLIMSLFVEKERELV